MLISKLNSLFRETRLVYAQSSDSETPQLAAQKLADEIKSKDITPESPIVTSKITEKAAGISKKIDGTNLTPEQKTDLKEKIGTILNQQKAAIKDNEKQEDADLDKIIANILEELDKFEKNTFSDQATKSVSEASKPVSEWSVESKPRVEIGTYTVNTSRTNLNLRDPKTGQVIGSLPKGSEIKVLHTLVYRIDIGNPDFRKNQFVEVEYNGKKGICALGYLKKSEAQPLETKGEETEQLKAQGEGGVQEGEPQRAQKSTSGQKGGEVEPKPAGVEPNVAQATDREQQERQIRVEAVEKTRPGRQPVPGGAAELGKMPQLPAEDLETLDRFTMDEKWEMLEAMTEGVELTPEKERRLEQLDMLQTLLDALSKETEDANSMKMKLAKGAFWLGIIDDQGAMQKFRDKIANFSSNIPAIKGRLLKGETLKDVVPQQLFDAIKGLSENWLLGREEAVGFNFEEDLDSEGDVTQQYSILVEFLRGWSRYDEAEKIMERRLDAVFKQKIEQLEPKREAELRAEAEKYADELDSKYRSKWREDLMNSEEYKSVSAEEQVDWLGGQLEAIRTSFYEEKLDTLNHREAAKNIKKANFQGTTDQKMWDQYEDMLDPSGEYLNWNIKDSTWDTIWEEVAINAPLIVLSGGIASGVRAGATALARRLAGRYALKQVGRTAGRFGLKQAGFAYTKKELAEVGARVLGSSFKRKAVGWAAGTLLEGAAFEVAHLGLSGDLLKVLHEEGPLQWAERILWSSATLGLFHGAGRIGEGLFAKTFGKTRLGKYIENISHPALKEICKQLLAKGHVEAAGMMFIGAVQHMAYGGSLEDLGEDAVENLIHAYISVGSLKIAGGIIHAGPRQWKGKRAKQAESVPRTPEKIDTEQQKRGGRLEEIGQKTESGKSRLKETETEIGQLQKELDSHPKKQIFVRRRLGKKIEKLTREQQKLQTKDRYLEHFREIDQKALKELETELQRVQNAQPEAPETLSQPEVGSLTAFKSGIRKVADKARTLISGKSQSKEAVTESDVTEVAKEMETVKAEAKNPGLSSRVKEYMSKQVGRLSRVFERTRSTLSRSEIGRAKHEIKGLEREKRRLQQELKQIEAKEQPLIKELSELNGKKSTKEVEDRRKEIGKALEDYQVDRTLIKKELTRIDSDLQLKKEAIKKTDPFKKDEKAVDMNQELREKEIRHCWELEKKVYNERRLTLHEDLMLVSVGFNPDIGKSFYELVSGDVGRNFNGHGIAKGNRLNNLLNLLEKGIDKGKEFSTAPFELRTEERAGGSVAGTAGGTCYKDGIAVVTSGYRQSLQEHGIKHVFINDVYAEMKEPLKKLFPQYEIHLLSEQKAVLEKDMSESLSKTTSETLKQRHERIKTEARHVSELPIERRIAEMEEILGKELTAEQRQWIEEIHKPGHPLYQEVGETKGFAFIRDKAMEAVKALDCTKRQAVELIKKGYLGAESERVVMDKAMEKWQKGDRITQLRQKLDNILGRNHEDYRKDATRNLIMVETRELSGVIEQCKRDISEYNRRLSRGAEYVAVKEEFEKSSKVSPPKKSSDGTLQVKTAEGSFIIFDAENSLYTKIASGTGQRRATTLENPALTARKKAELEQLVERAETRLDILKRTQFYESGDLKERIYYQGIELQGKKTLMIRNQEIIKNYQEQKAKLSKKSNLEESEKDFLEKIDSEIARLRKEVDANQKEADSMQHDIDQMTDRMLELEDSFKPGRSEPSSKKATEGREAREQKKFFQQLLHIQKGQIIESNSGTRREVIEAKYDRKSRTLTLKTRKLTESGYEPNIEETTFSFSEDGSPMQRTNWIKEIRGERSTKITPETLRISELPIEERIVEMEKFLSKKLTAEQRQWVEDIHKPNHPLYQQVGEAKGVPFMQNKVREAVKALGCTKQQALDLTKKGYLGAAPEKGVMELIQRKNKFMQAWEKITADLSNSGKIPDLAVIGELQALFLGLRPSITETGPLASEQFSEIFKRHGFDSVDFPVNSGKPSVIIYNREAVQKVMEKPENRAYFSEYRGPQDIKNILATIRNFKDFEIKLGLILGFPSSACKSFSDDLNKPRQRVSAAGMQYVRMGEKLTPEDFEIKKSYGLAFRDSGMPSDIELQNHLARLIDAKMGVFGATTVEQLQVKLRNVTSAMKLGNELPVEEKINQLENILRKELTSQQKEWIQDIHNSQHPLYQKIGETKDAEFLLQKVNESARILGCSAEEVVKLMENGYLQTSESKSTFYADKIEPVLISSESRLNSGDIINIKDSAGRLYQYKIALIVQSGPNAGKRVVECVKSPNLNEIGKRGFIRSDIKEGQAFLFGHPSEAAMSSGRVTEIRIATSEIPDSSLQIGEQVYITDTNNNWYRYFVYAKRPGRTALRCIDSSNKTAINSILAVEGKLKVGEKTGAITPEKFVVYPATRDIRLASMFEGCALKYKSANYYERLGFTSRVDDPVAIKKAFRRLVVLAHPDKFLLAQGGADHGLVMKDLNDAYETLRDPLKKQKYDQGKLGWDHPKIAEELEYTFKEITAQETEGQSERTAEKAVKKAA